MYIRNPFPIKRLWFIHCSQVMAHPGTPALALPGGGPAFPANGGPAVVLVATSWSPTHDGLWMAMSSNSIIYDGTEATFRILKAQIEGVYPHHYFTYGQASIGAPNVFPQHLRQQRQSAHV